MQPKSSINATLITLAALAILVTAWLGPVSLKDSPTTNLTTTPKQTSPPVKLATQEDFAPLLNRPFQTWNKTTSSSATPSIHVEDSIANAHGIVYQGSIIEEGHSFGFFKTDAGQAFKTLHHELHTDSGPAIILDIQPDHAIIQFNNQRLKLLRESPPPSTLSIQPTPSNTQPQKDPAAGRAVLGRSTTKTPTKTP